MAVAPFVAALMTEAKKPCSGSGAFSDAIVKNPQAVGQSDSVGVRGGLEEPDDLRDKLRVENTL